VAFLFFGYSMSDNSVEVKIGGDASEAQNAMAQAASAIKNSVGDMTGSLGALGEAFEAIKAPFLVLSAVLAGGAMFKEAINETVAYSGEVRKLTNIFGMTAENASKLAVELKLVGISTEEYTGMAMKLDRQLKNNESGINQMGVATRNASGALLSQQEIMKNAATILGEYKAGTDRNEAALYLFGKGAEEASKLLKMNNDTHERAVALATQLGLVLTDESQNSVKKYQMSMRETGLVFDAFMDKIGESVMPALTDLARIFMDLAVQVMPLVTIAAQAIQIGFAAINEIAISLKAGLDLVVISLKTFAAVASAALKLDFAGAKVAFDNGAKELEQSMTRHSQHMIDVAKNTATSVAEAWGLMDKEPEQSKPSGNKNFNAPDKGKGDSKIQAWKAELEEKKEDENNFFKSSLQMEEQFWQEKLALVTGNSKKDVTLRREISHELYAIHKQQAIDERATEDEKLAAKQKLAKLELDGDKEKLRLQKEMGDLSDSEYLQSMQVLLNKEYDIQLKALQDKLALYDQDKKAQQKIFNEIEVLAQEHANALKKTSDDVAIAEKKQYEQMMSPISSAIDKSVTGMIMGTTTLQKALANLGQSILGEFVSLGVKRLTSWIATEMTMTNVSKAWSAIRTAVTGEEEATAAATQIATQKAIGVSSIMSNSAIAATAAMASVAAIPVTGWAMAPGVGAETYATAMSFLPSAANGYDIPAGMNPLTQLHQKEMVLPAEQADVIRGMAKGGNGGGDIHMHVHTQSVQDFKNFLAKNSDSLSPALRNLRRNFGYA
jgi:hypothetical protein